MDERIGVQGAPAAHVDTEVKVWRRGAGVSRVADGPDNVACFHLLSALDRLAVEVCVIE